MADWKRIPRRSFSGIRCTVTVIGGAIEREIDGDRVIIAKAHARMGASSTPSGGTSSTMAS